MLNLTPPSKCHAQGSKSHTAQRQDAVKYGRVSSKEQGKEGFSIPTQFKLLDQYAKSQGLKVVREFGDVETAKRPGRAGFAEWSSFSNAHPACTGDS